MVCNKNAVQLATTKYIDSYNSFGANTLHINK